MVFGLAIATAAFSSSTTVSTVAACCCCSSGDSCPMKSKDTAVKDASAKDMASCCEGCEHCKGGEGSCPMMKDGAHKGEHVKGAHSCPMMKDAVHKDGAKMDASKHSEHMKAGAMSCPMKDKGEAKKADDPAIAAPVAAADKKSCNCACCAGHAGKQTVPAV